MSNYHNMYLGPYFEVPKEKVDHIINRHGCCSINCILHHEETKAKFCPECGNKTEDWKDTVKREKFDLDNFVWKELGEQLTIVRDDTFHKMDKYYLIPNVRREGQPRKFSLEPNSSFVIDTVSFGDDVESPKFLDEICWLQDAFDEEFKALQGYTGGKLSAEWGFLNWWS